MSKNLIDTSPDSGPLVATFFRFVIPSTLSLLAISTASVVDGFFVGNYIGAEALAAVNLLMPYFALLFGVALMFAVGGSVKASIYIGDKKYALASSIFSQVFFVILAMAVLAVPLSLIFSEYLFAALGATPSLYPLMQSYFEVFCFVTVVQLTCLVMYYFIRADNRPELGMRALMLGAFVNVALDALFIGNLGWGIEGAAWATLIGQVIQLIYISSYFFSGRNSLKLSFPVFKIKQLGFIAFNGFSEFINEFSIGLVILVFHWVISRQSGIEGIAAFSVVNYLIYISLMVYYGIIDAMHVLLGQNFGAQRLDRVKAFMRIAALSIAILSIVLVVILHVFEGPIIAFFLDDDAKNAQQLAQNFLHVIWPIFLFNGFNVLICAYLTSAEQAMHSSIIAMLRSLILPIGFALLLSIMLPDIGFLYAVPVAEALAFVFAFIFYINYRPALLIKKSLN